MTEYSNLSDFEINRKVLALRSGLKPLGYSHCTDISSVGVVDADGNYRWYDYCNNPADVWLIIFEQRIHINPIYASDWCATSECDTYRTIHKNPLRAAMIVYLMIQENEK